MTFPLSMISSALRNELISNNMRERQIARLVEYFFMKHSISAKKILVFRRGQLLVNIKRIV